MKTNVSEIIQHLSSLITLTLRDIAHKLSINNATKADINRITPSEDSRQAKSFGRGYGMKNALFRR
jgi:hypothetical protein